MTNGYLTCGATENFTNTNFSGFVWLYTTSVAIGERVMMWKGPFGTNGWYFSMGRSNAAGIDFLTNQSGGTATATGAFLAANQWFHVGFVLNGASCKLYSNGQVLTNAASGSHAAPVSSASNFLIGSYGGSANFIQGGLDAPILYNRSLSAAEVQWLYNEPFAMLRGPDTFRRMWAPSVDRRIQPTIVGQARQRAAVR